MPAEIEFSGGTRGKFYRSDARLLLLTGLVAIAAAPGVMAPDVADAEDDGHIESREINNTRT
jgi:hypothetical protein